MLVITALLLVVAVSSYLVPAQSEPVPTRLLFDTAGGKVILAHSTHAHDYGLDCTRCHHHGPAVEDQATPLACAVCHPAEFDDHFIHEHAASFDTDTCADCHHTRMQGLSFDHDAHMELLSDDCRACHHDTEIEPEPAACADCHDKTGDESMPSLKEAGHSRCSDCHSELDPGEMACRTCHALEDTAGNIITSPAPCADCHAEGIPLPTRTDAFHGQCMGCHQENQRGPFGDDSCGQCHFR